MIVGGSDQASDKYILNGHAKKILHTPMTINVYILVAMMFFFEFNNLKITIYIEVNILILNEVMI